MKPKIAKKGPYAIALEEGKEYSWCSCGESKNQPLCDGSHEGTGFAPLAFTAQRTRKTFLCGCKHTKNPPFCDGTHEKL